MWQDVVVTIVAFGAAGVLGWRWFGARARSTASANPSCASCASRTVQAQHTPGVVFHKPSNPEKRA